MLHLRLKKIKSSLLVFIDHGHQKTITNTNIANTNIMKKKKKQKRRGRNKALKFGLFQNTKGRRLLEMKTTDSR